MKVSEEKSLRIVKETIFDKIKRVISQMIKKHTNPIETLEEKEIINLPKEEITEKTNNKIEETEALIRKIETDEIKMEEQKDEELEQINANLARYLAKIKKEIDKNITEKNMYEMEIQSCKKRVSNE